MKKKCAYFLVTLPAPEPAAAKWVEGSEADIIKTFKEYKSYKCIRCDNSAEGLGIGVLIPPTNIQTLWGAPEEKLFGIIHLSCDLCFNMHRQEIENELIKWVTGTLSRQSQEGFVKPIHPGHAGLH